MTPDKKSLAPALDNGLTMLEMIAESKNGLAFNEIMRALPVSKSSVVRLLKLLCERKYVFKDKHSGNYIPGSKMSMLGLATPLIQNIQKYATPIIADLTKEAGGNNTAIVIYFSGAQMQTLNKIQAEGSITMMDVGTVRVDFSHAPWGWIFYDSMDDAQRAIVEDKLTDPVGFHKKLPAWMEYYKKNGFCYDRQEVLSHLRRLTAPFFDANGKITGAIGMGGTPLTMPDKNIKKLGKTLAKYANKLSDALK